MESNVYRRVLRDVRGALEHLSDASSLLRGNIGQGIWETDPNLAANLTQMVGAAVDDVLDVWLRLRDGLREAGVRDDGAA